ncbi:hypothetical protein ACFW1F_28280 [Streptomyces bungoensis]|uniref:hypothetical protein n=1 Tax=Streptomyces bungoensis TaxID=285568 RepID=UPI00342184BD
MTAGFVSYICRGASLLVVAAVGVGCSSDTPAREFTVPKALCGQFVPARALSDLLPASGKRLTVRRVGDLDDGSALCEVTVDGDTVLDVSSERIDAGDSARHILRRRLSVQEQKSAEGGSIAYTDRAAVSLIKCRGSRVEEDVSTLIKVLEPARPDESAMKKLAQGYAASLKAEHPCRVAS